MRLIMTRHGETEENLARIIQGHLPGKLSDIGVYQAKRLAKRLEAEKLDFIYSSDLARSADTAKEIAKFHPGAGLMFVQEMRERYWGELQGKPHKLAWGPDRIMPNDAEPIEQMLERADAFLRMLLKRHKNDTVLLVGHNGINKAILAAAKGKTLADWNSMPNFGNTSIDIIEIDEDRNHRIVLHNCTRHLDA